MGDMRLEHASLKDPGEEDKLGYAGRMVMIRSVVMLLGRQHRMDDECHNKLGYDPDEGSIAVYRYDKVRRFADGRHFATRHDGDVRVALFDDMMQILRAAILLRAMGEGGSMSPRDASDQTCREADSTVGSDRRVESVPGRAI